jgi:hypothetical protein
MKIRNFFGVTVATPLLYCVAVNKAALSFKAVII